jgi:hypothetical protein
MLHEETMRPPIDQITKFHRRRKRKYKDVKQEIDNELSNKEYEKRKNPFKIITVSSSAFAPDSEKNNDPELTPFLKIEPEDSSLISPNNEQSLGMGKVSKDVKQERNRICARECRLRKKLHLENMEKENRMLRKEIARCCKELSMYKAKEEAGLISDVNINAIITNSIDKLKTDNNNTKELFDNYMVKLVYKTLERKYREC